MSKCSLLKCLKWKKKLRLLWKLLWFCSRIVTISNISMHYRSSTEQMWFGDSRQPALVVADPARSMRVETRWSLWSFPTQAILWSHDFTILLDFPYFIFFSMNYQMAPGNHWNSKTLYPGVAHDLQTLLQHLFLQTNQFRFLSLSIALHWSVSDL